MTFKSIDEMDKYLKTVKKEKVKGFETYLRIEGEKVLHKWSRIQGKSMGTITQTVKGYRLYFNPQAAFAKNIITQVYEDKGEAFEDLKMLFNQ